MPGARHRGARHRGARHRVARHRVARPASWSLVPLVVVLALLGAGGVAWAAWTSAGAGTSTGRATTALAPTAGGVAGSAVTSGLLYPTGTGTVVLTVTNPNPYPVRVTQVAGNGTVTATGGAGTCATTGVALTTQAPGAALAAGGSTTLTLANAATMSSASETGCQGATFSIPVTVTVESA